MSDEKGSLSDAVARLTSQVNILNSHDSLRTWGLGIFAVVNIIMIVLALILLSPISGFFADVGTVKDLQGQFKQFEKRQDNTEGRLNQVYSEVISPIKQQQLEATKQGAKEAVQEKLGGIQTEVQVKIIDPSVTTSPIPSILVSPSISPEGHDG